MPALSIPSWLSDQRLENKKKKKSPRNQQSLFSISPEPGTEADKKK
jgi:hypothetical protein